MSHSLVEVVARGMQDNAAHATNGADDGDNHAEHNASPRGPEIPVANRGALEDEPDDRRQPECGRTSAECSNEAHQISKEGWDTSKGQSVLVNLQSIKRLQNRPMGSALCEAVSYNMLGNPNAYDHTLHPAGQRRVERRVHPTI